MYLEIFKLLGEGSIRIVKQPINNLHETGNWPKDFIEVKVIALNKKLKTATCSDSRIISLIAHSPKIKGRMIARIFEDILEEDRFVLRRGKETRSAIGILRITSERTLEIDEELCA
jgi:hypothetical protein